ncbi:hypothetical protein ACHEVM_16410 [Roseomonas sp. SXEYE002]|nr:hypothetical protein [Roseomonas sp. SXEYE001]MCV4209073.1 hypothetical protein [Roseomonas sp. SXEYE001]
MTRRSPLRLDDPLALSAGALPRLGWAALVSALLWGAVLWALSA